MVGAEVSRILAVVMASDPMLTADDRHDVQDVIRDADWQVWADVPEWLRRRAATAGVA